MKRIVVLAAAALLMVSSRAVALDKISAVVGGKYKDSIPAYRVGPEIFLSSKEAGRLYGAEVYWYPVAGRVVMSLRGHSVQFFVGSDQARLDAKQVKLGDQVLLRTSQAWIPLSFFESKDFAAWAGADTAFDGKTAVLTVDRRSSLGPARWYSYQDYTRISLDLDKRLQFSVSRRGVGGVEATIPFGVVDARDEEKIGDGLVRSFALSQGPKAAHLEVRFARPGLEWRAKELKAPRRLVVDVFRAGVVDTGDEALAAKASVPLIPPAVSTGAAAAPSQGQPPKLAAGREPAAAQAPASALPATVTEAFPGRRRIVVDAGHGGKDPGATGHRGVQEKDINLLAAKELAKLLRQEPRFDVVLTRDDDTFVPLADRSKKANDLGADLFISLHCNASPNGKEEGYEVYFLSEKASDPEAERLAEQENSVIALEGKTQQDVEADLLLNELAKTEYVNESSELAGLINRELARRVDITDRGVKQAGFYVLRGTHAPAVLFEMAYVTNRKDEARLESKRFRHKLELGVFSGIEDYARRKGWLESPIVKGQ